MSRSSAVAIWAIVALVCIAPVVIATTSPLLEWRDSIYIVASLGGVIALSIMLVQPLLAMGVLPNLSSAQGRHIHRWTGAALVVCVAVHIIGLWITSPPDVIDALLFVSATPFSIWGVIAMWSVLLSAFLAAFRRKLRLRPSRWRNSHRALATVTVLGSVAHAMMIEGTMGTVSKAALCIVVVIATVIAVLPRRARPANKSSIME